MSDKMLTETTRDFPNGSLISISESSRLLVSVEVQSQYKPSDPHRVRVSWMLPLTGSLAEAELMAEALTIATDMAREKSAQMQRESS